MSKLALSVTDLDATLLEKKLALAVDDIDTTLNVVQDIIQEVTPANGETGVALDVVFEWTDPNNYDVYKLSYDDNDSFTSPVEVWTTSKTTTETVTSDTYFWKVEGYSTVQQDVVVADFVIDDSVEGDLQALQDLYEVTDGANWTDNTGWDSLTTGNMGDAFGVTTNVDGRVTEINLVDNNLVNIELDVIGSPVVDNNFEYQLLLGKSIKDSIGNLKQMTDFQIHKNKLSGEIPSTFFELSNLEVCVLGHRDADVATQTFVYPTKDDYVGNKFYSDLVGIGNMTSLVRFIADRNYFTNNTIPAEISNCSNLEYLVVNHCGLSGNIPPELGQLSNLKSLQLQGGFAYETRENPVTRELTSENCFSGALPPELGSLSSLLTLRLSSNLITGEFPSEWSGMTGLRSFIVSGTNLSGNFPNQINNDNMPLLTTLFISDNQLGGAIDVNYNGSNLDVFTIVRNNITGSLPLCFTDSTDPNFNTKLKIFSVIGNSFTGVYADTLEDFFQNRRVALNDNNFTGSLPSVFVGGDPNNSEQCEFINFGNNDFSGAIPIGMGDMTSSETYQIYLSDNNLSSYESGAISTVVYDGSNNYVSGLRGLTNLGLENNDLPESALDQIILDLWDNVQSRLGTEWNNWNNNGEIDLRNQSTGAIPSQSAQVQSAITDLTNAGWNVLFDDVIDIDNNT